MEWKDVADTIKNIAPGAEALCEALTFIPGVGTIAAGARIGIGAITKIFGLSPSSSPNDVHAAIQADPQAAAKILQADNEFKLAAMRIELEETKARLEGMATQVKSVNETMQGESNSEKWPQYSWRPAVGFSVAILALLVGLTVIVSYIGVMYFKIDAAILAQLPSMLGAVAAIIATISPILGIAAWFRGKGKMQQTTGS
jgi:hypothetical protein